MAVNERCRIVQNVDIGPGYKLLSVSAPAIAAKAVPGQFVHVKVPSLEASALRRPFSIFDADPAEGILSVLYKQVGRGTAALAKELPGAEIEILGPLGRGFPVKCSGTALLVGGGFGVAPLHFLAKRLLAASIKPILFVGGRTKDDLLALDRFAAMGVECRVATNDGSAGEKGFVTGPLDAALNALREAGEPFEFFTCGPDGLLKAVSDRALETGSPGWISMDRHMVCGVGACYACIQRVKMPDGSIVNQRCCVNGPIFRAKELVW